jgi:putative endonuclease
MAEKTNYVYILRCADNTFYTGWTNNLEKRIKAHSSGKGAKYTKARKPLELLYFEEYKTKKEAMKREYEIKQFSRQKKEELIKKKNPKLKEY